MKKLYLILLLMFCICLNANAKSAKSSVLSIINSSGINKSSVSVSIKDLSNGKTVYKLNENTLMHPASVQKVLTLTASMDVLGENYNFDTKLYSRKNGDYIYKLSADPYLTDDDLKKLTGKIDKTKVKSVYVDGSVLENKDWGEGWQWDDDMNTLMPRFNSYNLNGNVIRITVMPETQSDKTFIINPSKYPLVFVNNVVQGEKENVEVTRDSSGSSNTIILTGTINSPVLIYIPVNNLKSCFNVKLTGILHDKNIYLMENVKEGSVKTGDKLVGTVSHPISQAEIDILQNSNNMASEIVSKLAGAKALGGTGTDEKGVQVFKQYCDKIGLDSSNIKLTDASGVSKNNLVNSDFITEFLYKNKNNKILEKMAYPGVGTLSNRMIPLQNSLKAKTGTLADISAIAGYLTSKKGKQYAFCIMINDPKSTSSDKKNLEDYMIREMYLNL